MSSHNSTTNLFNIVSKIRFFSLYPVKIAVSGLMFNTYEKTYLNYDTIKRSLLCYWLNYGFVSPRTCYNLQDWFGIVKKKRMYSSYLYRKKTK